MGTQQILMIVLSVIVVGAAVAVGIQMFDNQSKNQARAAIHADLLRHSVNIQAYHRTPVFMGGCSGGTPILGDMMAFINNGATAPTIETPNGTYTFTLNGTAGVNITMASVPTVSGWTALGTVAFDARTGAVGTANFERGIWTYVGPAATAPAHPTL